MTDVVEWGCGVEVGCDCMMPYDCVDSSWVVGSIIRFCDR